MKVNKESNFLEVKNQEDRDTVNNNDSISDAIITITKMYKPNHKLTHQFKMSK